MELQALLVLSLCYCSYNFYTYLNNVKSSEFQFLHFGA
jgi:hypothetical protein